MLIAKKEGHMGRRVISLLVILCVALLSASIPVSAADDPINTDKSGIAIKGTDTVAYFTENRPVKGNPDISYEWKGATWLFSSEQNREIFKNNPEKYAPQYGGY